MLNPPRLEITCDGDPYTTKLLLNGEPLEGVSKIEFVADASDHKGGIPKVRLEFCLVAVALKAFSELSDLDRHLLAMEQYDRGSPAWCTAAEALAKAFKERTRFWDRVDNQPRPRPL